MQTRMVHDVVTDRNLQAKKTGEIMHSTMYRDLLRQTSPDIAILVGAPFLYPDCTRKVPP